MNKRGQHISLEEGIFYILNTVFFLVFLYFVINASSGSFVLEQVYAKQIALLIDSASSDMTIKLDVSKGFEMAKENRLSPEKIIRIKDGYVFVQLSSSRYYKYPFFSDFIVEGPSYEISEDGKTIFLNIHLKEK